MGANKLKCSENANFQNTLGYATVTSKITNSIFEMRCDAMILNLPFDKPFKVVLDWDEQIVKQKS